MGFDVNKRHDELVEARTVTIGDKRYPPRFVDLDLTAEMKPLVDEYDAGLRELRRLEKKPDPSQVDVRKRDELTVRLEQLTREQIAVLLDAPADGGDRLTPDDVGRLVHASIRDELLLHLRFADGVDDEIKSVDGLAGEESPADPT